MNGRRARLVLGLVGAAVVSCKVPTEDQVPTPSPHTPAAPSRPVVRGEPPPEARRFVLSSAPPIKHPMRAVFEDQIELLGYDVPKVRFRPGEPVPLTLYWKALADVKENWSIFMHLDPAGVDDPNLRGYGDHFPAFGLYPTHQWKAGQIVSDQVRVRLHERVTTPTAELWVGLYIGDRRARLQAGPPNDGKNRLRMATFEVDRGGAPTASSAPKTYVAHRTTGPIAIDGRLDEPSWQQVPTTGRFTRTVGGGPAKLDTWAKVLWDDENLYIAFYCADRDIRSPYTKRDDTLWLADVVEVFIDAAGEGQSYVELQVSPANVIFDAYFPKRAPTAPNRGADFAYTAGIRSAVRLDGTLNQPGDVDRSWTVEMAIPLKDLKPTPRIPPRVGDAWRVNLIRVERTSGEIDDSAWSPPGNDYHNFAAMGRLVLGGPPGAPSPPAPAPSAEAPPGLRFKDKRLLKLFPQQMDVLRRHRLGDGGVRAR